MNLPNYTILFGLCITVASNETTLLVSWIHLKQSNIILSPINHNQLVLVLKFDHTMRECLYLHN